MITADGRRDMQILDRRAISPSGPWQNALICPPRKKLSAKKKIVRQEKNLSAMSMSFVWFAIAIHQIQVGTRLPVDKQFKDECRFDIHRVVTVLNKDCTWRISILTDWQERKISDFLCACSAEWLYYLRMYDAILLFLPFCDILVIEQWREQW